MKKCAEHIGNTINSLSKKTTQLARQGVQEYKRPQIGICCAHTTTGVSQRPANKEREREGHRDSQRKSDDIKHLEHTHVLK